MRIITMRIRPILRVVLLIAFLFLCQPIPINGTTIVSTDKESYNRGEIIRVDFFNAPGNEGDWICIVPAGSPDTEGGDYKYMTKGVAQGSLVFSPPMPGKYEARAYYNYHRNGYVVSGRYSFTVLDGPGQEAFDAHLMERKTNPANELEAKLPPDKGMVYIFREAFYVAGAYDVQVKGNGSPITFMVDSSYFIYPVSAGDVKFSSGIIRTGFQGSELDSGSVRASEITVKIKPGYVYYIKLRVVPMPLWAVFLDQVPHQEGANIIQGYKLKQIGK